MKYLYSRHFNERGFALITAIMMLFAATVMGLMVMNSSEIEILLSGAQQRYENDFNITEGALNLEARKSGKNINIPLGGTNINFNYQIPVPLPEQATFLSLDKSHTSNFDPGNDMTDDDEATEYTVGYNEDPVTDASNNPPKKWPMNNLVQSIAHTDDTFDYHYRAVYLYPELNKGTGTGQTYNRIRISTHRTTTIEMDGGILGNAQQAGVD
ncbi:MAG: pilus assembly PilX N-terminal domain-containing protein [Thermodesulfobacteriota bacterium]|nr:pilus assembly PilX N-terminal domain-containing protein [Thermodesulfobacteriota bacterium]